MDKRQQRIYFNIAGLVAVSGSLIAQYYFGISTWSWILLIVALVFMLASRFLRDSK
jgi:fatty acid desaturase